ncbi:MAG TPA: peptidylprolyl isomerase [Acetobacteraceae bacterium]|nr:peptidylprolyl isomerase [Acetobacteraceae bacterium]
MRTVIARGSGPAPVSVNGVVIAHAAIGREMQNHRGTSLREAWRAATSALVIRELLLQRARALGFEPAPRLENGLRETEEEALIRALLEAEVRTPEPDDASCRRYYENNPARFRAPELFEPLHILFKAPRADQAAHARAIQRAEAVLAELRAAPERFTSLARALSDCPSAAEGGRLGQVVRGETTPEFEVAMLRLRAGETASAPVCTRYGVHVLRLERRIPGELLPFERVKERIAAYLAEASWRRAVAQYVALLAGSARITGFDMPGAASPLVQ